MSPQDAELAWAAAGVALILGWCFILIAMLFGGKRG